MTTTTKKYEWHCRRCGRAFVNACPFPTGFIARVPSHCGLPCAPGRVITITRPRLKKIGAHHYLTTDGRHEVIGYDVGTSVAAGAGDVWCWRQVGPAGPTTAYSDTLHSFGTKARCLDDLQQHLTAATPTASIHRHGPYAVVVVTCACGQDNRLPIQPVFGKKVVCGRCKAVLR